MKKLFSLIFMIITCLSCFNSPNDKKEINLLTEAYRSGHLTVVSSMLKEIQENRKFTNEEEVLYIKTLFYQANWKDFFSHWVSVQNKTPELVLLYFKAVLLSKTPVAVSSEDESKLIELLSVSPEACLLYIKFTKNKNRLQEKKLILAQGKQFQTHLDRLIKELGENK